MATVTQTWAHAHAHTYMEVEQKLRASILQAQLDFWEKQAEDYRRELENIAMRLMKGERVFIRYEDKQVEVVSMTTAQRMSGDIP